ncbi:hypothetical protein PC120_g11600 [Phytophthora cactorum]|nr:hypothetical protein PC120_g11600 [Phytophthora cactorum]
MWVGPYRVVGNTDRYFTVEHLINGCTMDGTLLGVAAIVEHRIHPDQAYEVKVKCLGLEVIEDSWGDL